MLTCCSSQLSSIFADGSSRDNHSSSLRGKVLGSGSLEKHDESTNAPTRSSVDPRTNNAKSRKSMTAKQCMKRGTGNVKYTSMVAGVKAKKSKSSSNLEVTKFVADMADNAVSQFSSPCDLITLLALKNIQTPLA